MNKEPLTQEQIDDLLNQWNAEDIKKRRIVRRLSIVALVSITLVTVIFGYRYSMGKVKFIDILTLAACLVQVPLLLFFQWVERQSPTIRQQEMLKTITAHRSKETIPFLLKIMSDKIAADFQPLLPPIAEPLRQLNASDAPEYAKYSEQIAQLAYLHLTRTSAVSAETKAFVTAALQALQQIGTKDAIPFVAKIAALDDKRIYAKTVIVAAQECLPYLYQRAEHQHAEQTLLRASESKTPSDMLLRSATETETNSGELLRATGEI